MGYQTRQGVILLDFLRRNSGKHLRAEDIARALEDEGNAIGKATVYRHLEKLLEQGQLRKFSAEGESGACYQLAEGCGQHSHYHLLCSRCGELLHLECESVERLFRHILQEHGFVVSEERTVLHGVCRQCSGKETTQ